MKKEELIFFVNIRFANLHEGTETFYLFNTNLFLDYVLPKRAQHKFIFLS